MPRRSSTIGPDAVSVLHVTAYFPPARPYGGPPASVLGLCQGLQRAGVDVEVVTTTANGRDSLPAVAARRRRLRGRSGALRRAVVSAAILRRPGPRAADRRAVARRRLPHPRRLERSGVVGVAPGARAPACRTSISPRGMLQPQAMQIGRWRKAAAFALLDRRNLSGAALLHATSDQEAGALRRPRVRTADCGHSQRRRSSRGGEGVAAAFARVSAFPPTRSWCCSSAACIASSGSICSPRPSSNCARRIRTRISCWPDPTSRGCCRALQRRLSAHADHLHAIGAVHGRRQVGAAQGRRRDGAVLRLRELRAGGGGIAGEPACRWSRHGPVPGACSRRSECGFWVEQTAPAIAAALRTLADDPARRARMGERGRRLRAGALQLGRGRAADGRGLHRVLRERPH